jgi:hypothetical protein
MKGVAPVAVATVLLLALGTVWVVARGAPPSWDTANEMVDSWLAAMSEPSGDRGWSFLSSAAQTMVYRGDPQAYWEDLEQVDWAQVDWAPANGHVDDGAFYSGYAWLRSHPSTLPRFLVERGLATPHCVEGSPFGIDLQMRLGWFNPPTISALLGKAGAADPCWIAFDERPGTDHAPFDLVGGAWASPGPIQRVGVEDRSGLIRSVMWGRENPALEGGVEVTNFGPHELAVTWRGAPCDSNTTLVVEGTSAALRITVERGLAGGCSGSDVVYDAVLEIDADDPIENVEVDLLPAADSAGHLTAMRVKDR